MLGALLPAHKAGRTGRVGGQWGVRKAAAEAQAERRSSCCSPPGVTVPLGGQLASFTRPSAQQQLLLFFLELREDFFFEAAAGLGATTSTSGAGAGAGGSGAVTATIDGAEANW